MTARRPTLQWTASSGRQMAVAILAFSVVMLVSGLASLILWAPAPVGDLSRIGLRYMLVAVGTVGVAYSVYLFIPGVAERQAAKLAAVRTVDDRIKYVQRMVIIGFAFLFLVEVPVAVVLWSIPRGWVVGVGIIGGTLMVLGSMVATLVQQARGRSP